MSGIGGLFSHSPTIIARIEYSPHDSWVEKNGVIHLEATLTPHPHLKPGMSAIIALGYIEN